MPRVAKKSTSSRAKKTTKDDLMEFEQFVAQKKEKKSTNNKGLVIFTIVLLIIALGLTFLKDKKQHVVNKEPVFQTIHLESGQQLYGKVVKENALYLYVDEVYYVKKEAIQIPSEEEDGEPQIVERDVLVARGQEANAPVGPMQINRAKVFALDNMHPESEVMKLINQMKAQSQ